MKKLILILLVAMMFSCEEEPKYTNNEIIFNYSNGYYHGSGIKGYTYSCSFGEKSFSGIATGSGISAVSKTSSGDILSFEFEADHDKEKTLTIEIDGILYHEVKTNNNKLIYNGWVK